MEFGRCLQHPIAEQHNGIWTLHATSNCRTTQCSMQYPVVLTRLFCFHAQLRKPKMTCAENDLCRKMTCAGISNYFELSQTFPWFSVINLICRVLTLPSSSFITTLGNSILSITPDPKLLSSKPFNLKNTFCPIL